MKTLIIVLAVLASITLIAKAAMSRQRGNTEQYAYKVLKDFGSFEIRKYEPAVFSYVELKSPSYRNSSSLGFRQLAGYIFGGNQENQKIAMTSPVAMDMKDSMMVMKFMLPSHMKLEDLPVPNDSSVQFEEMPARTLAAIRFGGWATDDRIKGFTNELKKLLKENNIVYRGDFILFGYNPPYEVTNRRNEIAVEVNWSGE